MGKSKIQILLDDVGEQGFNGESHLDNFLHYLFRTDKKQKHTNDNTTFCLFSFQSKGEILTRSFGELADRMAYEDVVSNLIETQGLKSDDILNSLTYLDILDKDDNNVRGLLDYDDTISIIESVVTSKESVRNYLFHIAHLDQGAWHIHSVMVKE